MEEQITRTKKYNQIKFLCFLAVHLKTMVAPMK